MTRISFFLRHVARRRGRLVLTAGALAATAMVATAALSTAASTPKAGQRIDMKLLLLANTAGDADASAWEDSLKREGTPYDRINGATTLTAATFADGDRAKYQGVIVSGPDGTAGGVPAQFSAAEFELLRAFERKFGIRQLDVNAYPGPPLGLNFPGSTGTLDGQTATLTAAGLQQFPALKGPVPFEDLSPSVSESFGASATPCDGVAVATCNATSFETILQSPSGASLVGIAQTKDDREEMVSTFTGNQFQTHTQVLRHAMLSWVTGGVFIGRDRSYLSVDVDDIFLPDDRWNPDLNTTPEGTAVGQQDLRMTPGDVQTLVNFQNSKNVKLNMLFNGAGVAEAQAANGGVDALFDAFIANKAQFPWVNHTFTHLVLGSPNPGTVSQAAIESEIRENVRFAQTNALPDFDPSTLVSASTPGSAPPIRRSPRTRTWARR